VARRIGHAKTIGEDPNTCGYYCASLQAYRSLELLSCHTCAEQNIERGCSLHSRFFSHLVTII
jgi:hypothetical protein